MGCIAGSPSKHSIQINELWAHRRQCTVGYAKPTFPPFLHHVVDVDAVQQCASDYNAAGLLTPLRVYCATELPVNGALQQHSPHVRLSTLWEDYVVRHVVEGVPGSVLPFAIDADCAVGVTGTWFKTIL